MSKSNESQVLSILGNEVKRGVALREKIEEIECFIGHLETYDTSFNFTALANINKAIRGANLIITKIKHILNYKNLLSYDLKITKVDTELNENYSQQELDDIDYYKQMYKFLYEKDWSI